MLKYVTQGFKENIKFLIRRFLKPSSSMNKHDFNLGGTRLSGRPCFT